MADARRILQTWQEIASYLGFSVRAAQNYERDAGLPVHRPAGQKRGRVWAYADELDAWKSESALDQGNNDSAVPPAANKVFVNSNSTGSSKPWLPEHWRYASLISALYAVLYTATLFLEVAYRFDLFGKRVLIAAPAVFCWIMAGAIAALAVSRRQVITGKRYGILAPAMVILGSAALLQCMLLWVLPASPVTDEDRQPWPARTAYLKDVTFYFLPLAFVYMLVPFHFVLALERELSANRHGPVLALLGGEGKRASPQGTVYLGPARLAWGLFLAGLVAVMMTENLFDHLKPSPYKNLFMDLALGRTLLLFGIALVCLVWYSGSLNDVKQRCIDWHAARSTQ